MKNYTDLKQSKKLAKILPLGSADICYQYQRDRWVGEPDYKEYPQFEFAMDKRDIPCWSLAALFDALPEGVIENYNAPNLQKENGKYSIAYGNEELLCVADNPLDACYEMILKLNEKNLL